MPEMPDVVTTETIEVEWGNAIRDRTAQRYNDATTRDTETPSPDDGDLAFMENTGDLDVFYSGSWRHIGSPVGTVEMQAGATVPPGWLVCNGGAHSRTTYADLYAYLGGAESPWGQGDGETTFNVPDLRQRFPIGVAASGTANALGATGGAINHTHTGPSHTHTGPSHTHTVDPPATNTGLADSGSFPEGQKFNTETIALGHIHSVNIAQFNSGAAGTGNTGAQGTGNTGTNNPPFAALHFRIKT